MMLLPVALSEVRKKMIVVAAFPFQLENAGLTKTADAATA